MKIEDIAEQIRKTLNENRETMVALYLQAHPGVKIEDIRLCQQTEGTVVRFWIERKEWI